MASRTLLGRRPVQNALAVAIAATLLAVVLAPDTSPSIWDWMRIILIGVFGTGAVLLFALAQAKDVDDLDRQHRLIIAGAMVAFAIALNLTFTLGSTLVFSIGITVVALLAERGGVLRSQRLGVAILIAAVPFWVWSALQAWTWELLLLIPMAAIAVITDGHMRSATASTPEPDSMLSQRAHRLGAWAGILGSALIVMVAGLLTDASNGMAAIGAVGAIACVALEAGAPGASKVSSRMPMAIVDLALAWIALCWIVSL